MDSRITPPIVNTAAGLRELISDLKGHSLIAVDTEMDCFYHYYNKVCLLQISAGNADYLVDPLCLDLEPLNEIFSDPGCTAVFHAGVNDVPHLYKDHHIVFSSIYDTYASAELLNLPNKGLAGLVKEYFDIEIDKKYQKADWTVRPLSPEMDHYARYDTRFLISIWEHIKPMLMDAGLWDTALQSFRSIVGTRLAEHVFNPDGWTGIKNARSLDPGSYAVAKRIYICREKLAQKHDLAVFRVFPDHVVVKLALDRPRSLSDLEAEFCGSKYWESILCWHTAILDAVFEGIADGMIPWPADKSRKGQRMTKEQIQAYERLREWRNTMTGKGLISPALLTNKMLAAIVHRMPRSVKELMSMDISSAVILKENGSEIIELLKG